MRTQTFLLVAVLLCSFPNVSLSQNSDSGIQRYLSENKSSLGLTDADISDWIIYNEHTDKKLGITYKYLGQRYAGV